MFPELLGTLELRIVIHDRSTEAGTDLFHPGQLEATIRAIYKRGFPDPEDSNRLPDDYKSVDINGKAWLNYLNRGGKTSEDRLCYAIPITATHFLEASFRVIKTDESDTDKWYEVSQSDMEKMINSFSVNYTESSQPK